MVIGIEISLSKWMLAEVTVVKNTTAFKKEMPKVFFQGHIITRIFTLFFSFFFFPPHSVDCDIHTNL